MRFVVLIGIVSLFADMTYEGARAITGPYLAVLGASATTVGIVAGFFLTRFDEAPLQKLQNPDWPVCAELEKREADYFFWFLEENHADCADGVFPTLGFCREHAARLIDHAGC